ncbi:ABC transporter C family member 8-like [Dioscorea cayenensis subsp. rotundata]|uniref:ABC transporter C family member 8-like n=1 Tax=Dioscorea cayennensis subsp. rotundata TaxID=55577 RepID=A0AB40AVB9_DIOCR|nr:ABC transporter C family member 8-like [Dioscorea cayenensis subsp. rotundata]
MIMAASSMANLQGWLISWSLSSQRSLIDVVNLAFFVFYLLGLLSDILRKENVVRNKIKSWEFLVVSFCCAVTSIAYFTCGFLRSSVIYFVRGFIWIGLAVSLNIQPIKSLRLTVPIWWFVFSLLISAVNVEDLVKNHSLDTINIVSWIVSLSLLFCSIRLSFKNRSNEDNERLSLYQSLLVDNENKVLQLKISGVFSRLTFSWLNPLLKVGKLKPLSLTDIPSLDSEDGALVAYQKFAKEWESQKKNKPRSKNLVFFALAKCYFNEMLLVGLYALLKTISVSSSPILLYAFVSYSNREEDDLSWGLSLVVLLIVAKVVESLSQSHWFFNSRRCGMRMRSALMAAIFQKQFKLSSLGRRNHSAGEIVNYISVNAYRLGEFPWWFHMAWSLPVQLFLSVIILLKAVGSGALPGLVPLVFCAAINVPFAKILQGYQSKFMVAQDERLRTTSAALNNMKIIKLQSWEENFRQVIESLRGIEFKWLSKTQNEKTYSTALYWMAPTVVSAVVFAGTTMMRSAPLNAVTIFTVLASLRVMSEPVRLLPEVLSTLIQVKVSLDRIEVFLQEDEVKEDVVKRNPLTNSELSVKIENGVFSWDPDSSIPTLKNVDVDFRRGNKISVCGAVGSGKSSLLCSILGEIPKLSGSVDVYGSVAYVAQGSWIQSGTIRDNVLFGKPMNKAKYEMAIRCCALDKDIENFDHGDMTEIGQRGLNMSGGQKQRVQLARAVYNDADIYLLDDPFSAVDAHTAAILFHDCVMSALQDKTVILVTHQVEFLAETDRILVMENGLVVQSGSYSEILKTGTAFEQLVHAHKSAMTAVHSVTKRAIDDQFASEVNPQVKKNSETEITAPSAIQLTEDEEKAIGNFGWKPYKDYLQVSKGYMHFIFAVLSQCAFILFQILSTYWLAVAVQLTQIGGGVVVGVYAAVSILSCCFVCVRSWIAAKLGLKASKEFFSAFMDSVFRAPMLFFDSTPVGRILTRASSDMSILDFDIPCCLSYVISGASEIVGIIVIMSTVTWQVLLVAIPVTILTLYVQRYYLASARELVRINGTTKAPVVNYVGETILGVVTIRAFAMMDRFIQANLRLIDTDATLFFHTIATMEWVLIRAEALQNLTILTSALFFILLPCGSIPPGFVGLALSYALTLSSAQVFTTRWYSNLENYIISVERIKQFMHLDSEPPAVISDRRPPPSWPHEGSIDFQELKVKYRPNAPYVLKGITCRIMAGNKVGVVGRTGSGKTTLIGALFRLLEPAAGRILIDSLDICSIGLKDLRMKLSIIPQEPTLFKGTVRSNLDPLGLHSDQEIWEALEKCQLKTVISSDPSRLDSSVSDDGENWSAGQRQLFCLGRVLLRKNKIIVLDEATASIDSATDAVLQRIIRQEFSSCTVVTIAHRVPTVTDSDMVMLLSYGKLVEYDKPLELMERKDSYFSKLVAEYWSNCKGESR